ncbi:MAG TPA: hypothetical protein VGD60_11800 [Candidatus Acidoferrales bacterium]
MGETKRAHLAILYILEVATILVAILLVVPSLDHDRRERMESFLHPSVENTRVLDAKDRHDFLFRLANASPFAIVALLIAFRIRSLHDAPPQDKLQNEKTGSA